LIRQWKAALERGHVIDDMADAVSLFSLSRAGVVNMSYNEFNNLPARVQIQLQVIAAVAMSPTSGS